MTLSPLLSSIEARVKAATCGKWYVVSKESATYPEIRVDFPASLNGYEVIAFPNFDGGEADEANADFIAHAPTDLTRLIALCRAQERVIEAYRYRQGHLPDHERWDVQAIELAAAESALATLLKEFEDA